MRSCKDDKKIPDLVEKANVVVAAVRDRGVTSFFAAEYAKYFSEPEAALSTRERLIADFEVTHALTTRRAAKMADCIIFAAAKKPEIAAVERLSKMASEALAAGVPFTVAADVVYYNSPEVDPQTFSRRCVVTSTKQNRPMDISEVALANRLSAVV